MTDKSVVGSIVQLATPGDVDAAIARANERWAKRGEPQRDDGPVMPDWIIEIEQRCIAARYGDKNSIANSDVMKLIAEIRSMARGT